MRRPALLTAFGALATLIGATATGCIEEKLTVELQPDRSGRFSLDHTLGAEASSNVLSFAEGLGGHGEEHGGEGEREGEQAHASVRQELAEAFGAQILGQWRGVEAWSDIEVEVTADKRLHVTGTGWFPDLAKLARVNDKGGGSAYAIEEDGDDVVVRVSEQATPDAPGEGSLFDGTSEELAMNRQMTKGVLANLLEGLRQETILHLPGPVTAADGFTQVVDQPRQVTFVREAKDVEALIDSTFTIAEELIGKVESGELDKEQAERQLKERLSRKTEISARFTPAGGEVDPAFAERYQAAKAAWVSSPWKAKLEEAQEPDPLQPGSANEDLDGSEPSEGAGPR